MAPYRGRVRPRPGSIQTQKESENSLKNGAPSNGRTIGKGKGEYYLGKTVGEGTFGKVKLGTQALTGEKVAIKILEKSRIVDLADVRRVTREIKILKKNRHPNVIQLYEVVDSPSHIYLVMEYCDGGEMFDYIVSHRRVQEQKACWFFHQIIDGVEYFHNLEVTHRDLKPENLLLQSSIHGWIVKVVDFGLSNLHEGGVLLSTACGSPCYAAPEMIAGKKYWGPKADTWSIGVILFALVCGFLPFEDPNTSTLYKKILSGKYNLPSFVSQSLRDLLKHILDTNPETRYSVNEIRQHPWYNRINVPIARPIPLGNLAFDQDVLSELCQRGLNEEEVKSDLENNCHKFTTAGYYLLLKRNRRRKEKEEFLASQSMPERVMEAAISCPTGVNPSKTVASVQETRPTTTEGLVLPDTVTGKAKPKDPLLQPPKIIKNIPKKDDMPSISPKEKQEDGIPTKGTPRVRFMENVKDIKIRNLDNSQTSEASAVIIDEGRPLSMVAPPTPSFQVNERKSMTPHPPGSTNGSRGKAPIVSRRISPRTCNTRRKSVETGALGERKEAEPIVPKAPATTQNTPYGSPRASINSPRIQHLKMFTPKTFTFGEDPQKIKLQSLAKENKNPSPLPVRQIADSNKVPPNNLFHGRHIVNKSSFTGNKGSGVSRPASPVRPPSSRANARSPLLTMAKQQLGRSNKESFNI